MFSRDAHRRAWRYRHPLDLWFAVPGVLGTLVAILWFDQGATLVQEAAVFGATLVVYVGQHLFRVVTGRAPKGSPRTLYGLNTRGVKRQLRRYAPRRWATVYINDDIRELDDFAKELAMLLQECGWPVDATYVDVGGYVGGGRIKGVEIHFPPWGNDGLEDLMTFLIGKGFVADLVRDDQNANHVVIVGDP